MDQMCREVVLSCVYTDRLPVSLDLFIHQHSLLPCSSLIREYPHLHGTWYTIVRTLLEQTDHKDSHRQQLHALRQQLEDPLPSPLPVDDVQPICDPDRTRYLQEFLDGTDVNRVHIETLLEREDDVIVVDQTTYMKEAILAQFPLGGLDTDSAVELVSMYIQQSS
jgi:hypothetical protein